MLYITIFITILIHTHFDLYIGPKMCDMKGERCKPIRTTMYKEHYQYIKTEREEKELSVEDFLTVPMLSKTDYKTRAETVSSYRGSKTGKERLIKSLGVKGYSAFLRLPYMQLDDITSIDVMHFIVAISKHFIRLLKGIVFLKKLNYFFLIFM